MDNTVKKISTFTFTDGTTGHSKTDGGHTNNDVVSIDKRISDPLQFLVNGDSTGWAHAFLENGSKDGEHGNQYANPSYTGVFTSHMVTNYISGAKQGDVVADDTFLVVGELADTNSWFNIKNSDGSYANEKFISAEDGTQLNISTLNSDWKMVLLTDAQTSLLLRAMGYVASHQGTTLTYNYDDTELSNNMQEGLKDLPVAGTNVFAGTITVEVVDQDGNVIYTETDVAKGGRTDPSDPTNLADESNDTKAKGSVDINDVLNNLFAGKNADGTDGTIKYVAGDGNDETWTNGDGTLTVEVSFTEAANGGVTVTYHVVDTTPADATITYVDEDGNVIGTKDVTGPKGKDTEFTVGDVDDADNPLDGWVVDEEKSPGYKAGETSSVLVEPGNDDDLTIVMKHGSKTIDPDNPTDPDFPDNDYSEDTHFTATETVHYVDENGNTVHDDKAVTQDYTREVTIDAVTGEVIGYGDWVPANGTGVFDDVTTPTTEEDGISESYANGYTPDHTVISGVTPKITDGVDNNDSIEDNTEITVEYKADPADATIKYVDNDNKFAQVGDLEVVTGVTDGTYTYTITVPDGYEYVSTVGNTSVDNGDGTITILFVAGDDTTDDITIHLKHKHREVDPSDPDFKDYTTTTITQHVNYHNATTGEDMQDSTTNTITYTRTVVIDEVTGKVIEVGEWTSDNGTTFAGFDAPEFDGYFADQQHIAETGEVDPKEDSKTHKTSDYSVDDVDIYYYSTEQTVEPTDPKNDGDKIDPDNPNSPVYPGDVADDDLNATVTQTVHYVDENGNKVADDKTEVIHYTRTGTVHYDEQGNYINTTYSDWVADGTFGDITSPDVDNYFTLDKTVAGKTVTDPQNPGDMEDTVTYYPTETDVTPDDPKHDGDDVNPDDPNSPVYPPGVDENDLNASVTQTVHYVDENGNEVAGDYTITVDYTRTAHVTYDQNGDATVEYGDWVATGTFDAVTSPDVDGYFTLDKSVAGKTVTDPQTQADFDDTVIYYATETDVTPDDPKDPDTPIDPSDPDSPNYPDGVDDTDLNAYVTETVHYVDGETGKELAGTYTKTVHYTRTAHITYDQDGNATVTYGDWSADGSFDDVTSPDVDGYFTTQTVVDGKTVTDPQNQADFDETVKYYKTTQEVDPDDPKDPDTPIDPDNPNSPDYPAGVDEEDLNQYVTETVHYVDAETGKELADTYTKTVHYTRHATITYDKDGNATVTYGDWKADGTFNDVTSPDVDGYFADRTTVDGRTMTEPGDDFSETVYYYKDDVIVTPDDPKNPDTPIDPDNPNSPDYPDGVTDDDLNQYVTETVHYVDAETGKELADTYTKTVHYTRTAHVTYDKDGNATVTYGAWEADGSFDAVDSPDIDGYVADRPVIDGRTITEPGADFNETVYYYDADHTVTPDSPKHDGDKIDPSDPYSPAYPAGVDESDLNKDVTETIHYVDGDTGAELADTYTRTVHYTREAHVHFDADGNATVTYGEWVADGSFEAVESPDVDGYVADQDVIAALDNPTDSVDLVVTYHHAEVAPTPAPAPEEPSAPAPKPAPAPAKKAEPVHETRAARYGHVEAKKLPQTGDDDNTSMSAVGVLGLLAGSLGIFGLAKKRKRDGEE